MRCDQNASVFWKSTMRRILGTILFCLFLPILAAGLVAAVSAPQSVLTVMTRNVSEDVAQDRVYYVAAKTITFEIQRQLGGNEEQYISANIKLFDFGGREDEFRLRLMLADGSDILDAPLEFRGSAIYDDFVNQRSWIDTQLDLQPTLSKNRISIGEPVKGIVFAKAKASRVTNAVWLPTTTVSAGE